MTATLEAPAAVAPARRRRPDRRDRSPPRSRRGATRTRWLGWLLTARDRDPRRRSPGSGRSASRSDKDDFDEVYYATEAQELLRYGYEDNRGYMFIVHPPLGKWLIARPSVGDLDCGH